MLTIVKKAWWQCPGVAPATQQEGDIRVGPSREVLAGQLNPHDRIGASSLVRPTRTVPDPGMREGCVAFLTKRAPCSSIFGVAGPASRAGLLLGKPLQVFGPTSEGPQTTSL